MNKKELYQIYFDWTTDARSRFPDRPIPEPIHLAQYVANPGLDTDSNYPGLVEWAPVLRHIRSLYEDGEISEGIRFADEFFDTSATDHKPKKQASADLRNMQRKSRNQRTPKPEPKPEPEVRREANVPVKTYEQHQLAAIDAWDLEVGAPLGTVDVTLDGEDLQVQWSGPAEGFRIYRVYSHESGWPDILDVDALRGITTATSFTDDIPLDTAARFFQVWVHIGATEAEARQSQPVFFGQSYYIAPVEIKNPAYDGAHISAQWDGLEGTEKVEVYRSIKPRVKLDTSANLVNQEQNRSGVRFVPQERGYTYRIGAKRFVLIDDNLVGSALSEEVTVDVGAELEDIAATTEMVGPRTVRVSWQPPRSGTVRIYRTSSRIEDGADKQKSLDLDLLDQYGLPEQTWVNSTSTDRNEFEVTWPDDWYTMHVTIVSVVGGHARISSSIPFTRVGDIESPRLLERVDEQVLSFGWPQHATSVQVFIGEPGGPHETQFRQGPADRSIAVEDYRRTGNLPLQLHTSHQQATAASIALYPMRMQEGKPIVGNPAVVDYPGLEVFRYELFLNGDQINLRVKTEQPLAGAVPHFVLVHCRGRLPLESSDGEFVKVRAIGNHNTMMGPGEQSYGNGFSPTFGPDGYSETFQINPDLWSNFTFHQDFLRLFLFETERAAHEPRRALLDPAPSKLSLVEFLPQNQQPVQLVEPAQPEPRESEHKGFLRRMFGK